MDTANSTCTYKDGSTIDNLTLSYDSDTKAFSITPYTTKGTKCTLYFNSFKNAVDIIEELYEDNQDMLAYDGTSDNNLRYIGADPNNYVTFNGELWRIIGVMNNIETAEGKTKSLVKLIRNESIGKFSWDYDVSDDSGDNDWSTSTLQELLNTGAYYNATTGSYYNGIPTATSIDFTKTGLQDDTTRNMIESVVWNLGDSAPHFNASDSYVRERSTTVYESNNATWTGKVGLMYPSDYGFATSSCSKGMLSDWYMDSECYNNDWLYDSYGQWTISRYSELGMVLSVISDGFLFDTDSVGATNIYPSIYLKSNITITEGLGTSVSPYILSNS